MKYYSQHQTELFNDLEDSLKNLNRGNRWIRLADALPWAEIEKEYNKRLRNQKSGAGNKPARMVVSAFIVKHMMNLSDEETILMIQENPYMQYLAGLSEFQASPIFTPELMTIVRHRLGEDFFNSLTLMVAKAGIAVQDDDDRSCGGGYTDEDGEMHSGVMKIDATCTDAEMRFPTDINLLEDGSREVDRLTQKICGRLGLKTPRTQRGQSRSAFMEYTKRKHKGAKLGKETRRRQIHCLEADLETLMSIVEKMPSDNIHKILKPKDMRNLDATLTMLRQQEEMLSEGVRNCADRIVSIFQPHVRPIVRGKAKARTEFGAKVGLSVVNGYDFIDTISWNAYNESNDLQKQIKNYKARFGYYPSEVQADKIYLNKENRKLLKDMHIFCHCAPLGRPPKNPDPLLAEQRHKASCERNEVEGSFGTGKRRYQANNIRAKLPDTARSWISGCFLAKNLKKFLRDLLLRFFEISAGFLAKNRLFDIRLTPVAIYPILNRQIV